MNLLATCDACHEWGHVGYLECFGLFCPDCFPLALELILIGFVTDASQ